MSDEKIKIERENRTIYVNKDMTPLELEEELMKQWENDFTELHITEKGIHVKRPAREEEE